MNSYDFDRRTVAVVVAVLLAAVVATVIFTRRAVPASPVAAPVVSLAPTPGAASPSPFASPTAEIVVEVVGKVRRPLVVTLPKGSRVLDALEAAGGAKPGVDTSDQNLARLLVDGEQIRIGLDPPAAATTGSAQSGGTGGLIDINTATAQTLEQLPGVGPVLAERIIAYRDQNGGFQTVEQLTEVSGIGEATFAQMQPLITVGSGG